MNTLILRTFAHPNIWEGVEGNCYFELTQKRQILEWEPDFISFKNKDFDCALGIYTDKYFSGYFEPVSRIKKIANTGTNNEKIISKLKIKPNDKGTFPVELNQRIYVGIQFESKLWKEPDIDLMLKIDNELIAEKSKEVIERGVMIKQYKPLAFSLSSEKVNEILNRLVNHDNNL